MDFQTVNTFSTLIFGIGQVALGASIALWAIFKTRKDAAVTQNETMKLQMQQQIRTIVLSSYKDFRHAWSIVDHDFDRNFSRIDYKPQLLLITNTYFPKLRDIIFTYIDNLLLFGSSKINQLCNKLGYDVKKLNDEYLIMIEDLYRKEPSTENESEYATWIDLSMESIGNRISDLKSIYNKYQEELISALREDMGIIVNKQ